MDERAVAIQNHLLRVMPERTIFYQYGGMGGLHKFRLEGEPPHWLYVSFELVHDSDPEILVNLINIYRIAEALSRAAKSKWLFLSSEGVREVDENFTK